MRAAPPSASRQPGSRTRRRPSRSPFAEAVAAEHTAISGAQVTGLFDAFTIPQVVELLTWISFEYAGQMLGSLIGDESATAEEREAFAASVASEPQPSR